MKRPLPPIESALTPRLGDHPRPIRTWVCDGCMDEVSRRQIADMADGEHVICRACADGGF